MSVYVARRHRESQLELLCTEGGAGFQRLLVLEAAEDRLAVKRHRGARHSQQQQPAAPHVRATIWTPRDEETTGTVFRFYATK